MQKRYYKKLTLLLVSVSLILASCITSPTSDLLEDPSPRQNLSNTSNNVSLSLDKTTYILPMRTLTFHIHNAGDAVYTYGEFFYIEKEWYMLEIEDSVFDDFTSFDNYGSRLAPGDKADIKVAMDDYGLTFDKGTYRIVKAFSNKNTGETTWLEAEFEVID
ncbi:immunoglobulin-like domain-containing protein [Salinicoccus siamensis]|uniref:Immunoglobulin-like domain-containing protein n=1 Tax=Salinicoccus siamensis TaxID=381830 RepID=A0ABV5Z3M9_9STAP